MPSGQSLRRVSASEPATRPPWEMRQTLQGGGFSTVRLPPRVAEGRSRPAAASNPSPGPARTAQAQRGLASRGVELATGGAGEQAWSGQRAGPDRGRGEGGHLGAAHLLVPVAAGWLHRRQSRQRQRHGAAGCREGGRASKLKGRGRCGLGASRGRLGRAWGGSRWPPPLPGQPLSSGSERRRRRRRRGSDAVPGEEAGTTTTTLRRRPAPDSRSAARPVRPGLARRCCCPPWAPPVVPLPEAEASESVPSKTGCRSPQRGRRWWWVPGSKHQAFSACYFEPSSHTPDRRHSLILDVVGAQGDWQSPTAAIWPLVSIWVQHLSSYPFPSCLPSSVD